MRISRNDPCPCGSGKKYKRCHLDSEEPLAIEASVNDGEESHDYEGPAVHMLEYARPLFDACDGSEEQVNRALSLGVVCWDLALLPPAERERALSDSAQKISEDEEDREAYRSIVRMMIERHEQLFPELHGSAPTNQ